MRFNYHKIAIILNRDDRTIWGAYNSSKIKMPEEFDFGHSNFSIPLSVLSDRNVSTLEAITEYLKENYRLKYSQIACLLNRNDRTVWTVYNRAKKKRRKYGQPA